MNGTLTDVPGLLAGHYTDAENGTGCTVVLTPPGTTGGVDVRGAAFRLAVRPLVLPYAPSRQFSARSRSATYSANARRPSGIAATHVRGFASWNSFVIATYPASSSFRRCVVMFPPPPRQVERLLDERVREPVCLGLGGQQRHDAQPRRLVDRLVEDDGLVGHSTPLLRIHAAPSSVTATAPDTASAASPVKWYSG